MKEAFESWLLNTFRNYLNNRSEAESHIPLVDKDCEKISLLTESISNGYCLFNQRNGIHTLANSFHVCRCQSEGVEVFWFSYLSFTDDKEGLFNQP